jgi:hypothetical protein
MDVVSIGLVQFGLHPTGHRQSHKRGAWGRLSRPVSLSRVVRMCDGQCERATLR